MLCTSPDARCDSKMVMASVLGVRGQYHCWIWTWLFSCKQDRGPCQSLCPLRQPDHPKKGMSGVTEELWLSLHFALVVQLSLPQTGLWDAFEGRAEQDLPPRVILNSFHGSYLWQGWLKMYFVFSSMADRVVTSVCLTLSRSITLVQIEISLLHLFS